VELKKKGKNMLSMIGEDLNSKMVGEAKHYLKNLEELMVKLSHKRSDMRAEKYKLESKYDEAREDIE
jgi:hypothetical protein